MHCILKNDKLQLLGQERGRIKMISKIAVLVSMILLLSTVSAIGDSPEKEAAAAIAAEKWLGIMDGEKYAESWKEASDLFRNLIKQEQWEQSARAARKTLGRVLSRQIATKTYATSLPGAPDEEYVIIQFESSFENKKLAVETVTPMLEKDGKWRVSGYYIE